MTAFKKNCIYIPKALITLIIYLTIEVFHYIPDAVGIMAEACLGILETVPRFHNVNGGSGARRGWNTSSTETAC